MSSYNVTCIYVFMDDYLVLHNQYFKNQYFLSYFIFQDFVYSYVKWFNFVSQVIAIKSICFNPFSLPDSAILFSLCAQYARKLI